jgi:hypothetical protein
MRRPLTLTLLILSTNTPAATAMVIRNACHNDEVWELTGIQTGNAIDYQVPHSSATAIANIFAAYDAKTKPISDTDKEIAEFVIARSLQALGISREAFRHYAWVALKTNDPKLTNQALMCMTQITHRLPTLAFPLGITNKLTQARESALDPQEQTAVLKTALNLFFFKLSRGQSDVNTELEVLATNHGASQLALGYQAMAQKQYAQGIEQLNQFLTHAPESLTNHVPPARQMVAMAQYSLEQYSAALHTAGAVHKKSDNAELMLSLQGWTHLRQKRYFDAIDEGFNMISGTLKRAYGPEGWLISGISYYETCNYFKLKNHLTRAQSEFGAIYSILYKWYKNEKNQTPDNYFNYIKSAQGKSQILPPQIIAQWIASPLVTAFINEYNQALFERDKLQQIIRFSLKNGGISNAGWEKFKSAILSRYRDPLSPIIAGINRAIARENLYMIRNVQESIRNSKFLSIDLRQKTAQFIRQNPQLKKEKPKKNLPLEKSFDSRSLKFDSLTFGKESQSDFWEDEAYTLHVDLKNRCKE